MHANVRTWINPRFPSSIANRRVTIGIWTQCEKMIFQWVILQRRINCGLEIHFMIKNHRHALCVVERMVSFRSWKLTKTSVLRTTLPIPLNLSLKFFRSQQYQFHQTSAKHRAPSKVPINCLLATVYRWQTTAKARGHILLQVGGIGGRSVLQTNTFIHYHLAKGGKVQQDAFCSRCV